MGLFLNLTNSRYGTIPEFNELTAKSIPLVISHVIEMGIPIGSQLIFIQNPENSVEVVSNKKVLFNQAETSLTAVTRELLELPYSVGPGPHWHFNGRVLRDIYDETYELL